jgi:putative lipoprotein
MHDASEPAIMRRFPACRDLIAVAVLAVLGASAGRAQGAKAVQLTGGEWIVENIAGVSVGGDRRLRIAIAVDGRVTGSGGCNRLMGRAEVSGATITFGRLATTRMACAAAVMQQERTLLDALAATRSYRIAGKILTMHDASGAEIVRLERST